MPEPSLFPDASKAEEQLKNKKSMDPAALALSQSVTALGARLRVLEERYTNLRHKTQLTDQNMLELEKDIRGEVKRMQDSLQLMKKDLDEVSRRTHQIADELGNSVKESDFKVLQKYVEFWEPLQFITREEAEQLLGLKKPEPQIPVEEEDVGR